MASILEMILGGQSPNQTPFDYNQSQGILASGMGPPNSAMMPQQPQMAQAPQGQQGIMSQPGILERMGFATDNFGGRLANALMSAGSADPAATLSRLQASGREAKQVKRTTLGNGAFTLEERPDGTSQIVPNKEVADYNTRIQANKQKPPTGYRYTAEGDLEVIPGGPVDAKNAKADAATDSKNSLAMGTADNSITAIDSALGILKDNQYGPINLAGGVIGQLTGGIGQTPAYDLRKAADTVKANVGFQQLQQMREASPTGGALGQVAVQELTFLQAAISSLDTAQSPDVLAKNLQAVRTHFSNWKQTIEQDRAQKAQGGAPQAVPQAKPAALSVPGLSPGASQYFKPPQ